MAKASTSSKGKYTFAELRSEVKDEVKKTGKGGRPGYWRARKRMPIKMRRTDISKVAYIRMRPKKRGRPAKEDDIEKPPKKQANTAQRDPMPKRKTTTKSQTK